MPSPLAEYRELLLGCGNRRIKEIRHESTPAEWQNLMTLDIDPNCKADVEHDLERFPYPFPDNTFDEIHAYEVLEHCGTQGDYKFFFRQFEELWRILKPNARLIGSVPGDMATHWCDPGHRRYLTMDTFSRLNQEFYRQTVGTPENRPTGDYRFCYRADFEGGEVRLANLVQGRLYFCFHAIKPSRIAL